MSIRKWSTGNWLVHLMTTSWPIRPIWRRLGLTVWFVKKKLQYMHRVRAKSYVKLELLILSLTHYSLWFLPKKLLHDLCFRGLTNCAKKYKKRTIKNVTTFLCSHTSSQVRQDGFFHSPIMCEMHKIKSLLTRAFNFKYKIIENIHIHFVPLAIKLWIKLLCSCNL